MGFIRYNCIPDKIKETVRELYSIVINLFIYLYQGTRVSQIDLNVDTHFSEFDLLDRTSFRLKHIKVHVVVDKVLTKNENGRIFQFEHQTRNKRENVIKRKKKFFLS